MPLESVFSCPLCSRMFLQSGPSPEGIPRHLDPLLGTRCAGSDIDHREYL